MQHLQNLPANQRLKSRKQIELLFGKGKSFSVINLRVTYLKIATNGIRQVAFSAPKRNFKKAVDRNRIKRLMKEVYRKQKYLVKDMDNNSSLIFLVSYTGKEMPEYQILFENMTLLLSKLNERIARNQ